MRRVTVEGLNQALRKGVKPETVVRVKLSLHHGERCIRDGQFTTPKKLGPVGTVIWNERLWMDPNIKIKDLPNVSIACEARHAVHELQRFESTQTKNRKEVLQKWYKEGLCLSTLCGTQADQV